MKVVTGCDKSMKWVLDHWLNGVNKFDYDYNVYDLGGLGTGPKIDVKEDNLNCKTFPPCLFKPKIILNEMEITEENKLIIWIDVDAIIRKDISELENDNFDVAFTKRRQNNINKWNDIVHGIINAGVCCFRNNNKTLKFVKQWKDLSEELDGDQKALNKILIKDLHDDNLDINYYSTDEYNNYHFDGSQGKIIHYKGGLITRLKK